MPERGNDKIPNYFLFFFLPFVVSVGVIVSAVGVATSFVLLDDLCMQDTLVVPP